LTELDRIAVLAMTEVMRPARSASIWFIIFMASMMHTLAHLDFIADLDEGLATRGG